MSFWELVGLVVFGAGTFASILGVFYALYARQNGRATREFIAAQLKATQASTAAQLKAMQESSSAHHQATQELIAAEHRRTQEFMAEFTAAQTKDMREFLARVLERLGDRISEEGEKTRQEIRQLRPPAS